MITKPAAVVSMVGVVVAFVSHPPPACRFWKNSTTDRVAVQAAATPTPPGSSLHLDLKHTNRIKGTLAHPQGKLHFDSTPSNMTLDVADVDAASGMAHELMTLSRHCLPGTGRCPKEENQLVILTTPTVRLVLLRGKTFALPDDVDVRSKTSITRFFGRWRGACEGCEPWSDELVQVGAEEEYAAIESFYHEYDAHMAALQQLYHTLYQERAVTGSSHDSSIPLFVTALTHASAVANARARAEEAGPPGLANIGGRVVGERGPRCCGCHCTCTETALYAL
eukprot:COSAG04_NODE_2840_length_3499_cov_1.335000_2_plen_280_part_00